MDPRCNSKQREACFQFHLVKLSKKGIWDSAKPKTKSGKNVVRQILWELQIEFFNFEIWVGTRGNRVSGYPKRSDDAVCIGNISVVLAFSARLPAARFAVSLRPEVAAECDTDAARSWRHNRPRRNFVPPNGALWAKQQTVCYLCK